MDMEYLENQSESDGCDEHSNSDTESFKPFGSNSHTTSPSSPVQCSKSMALDWTSPNSPLGAYVGSSDSLNCEEKLTKRKNLLSDRLRELQARSQVYDNSARSIRGDHAFGYLISNSGESYISESEEQSYWPSNGRSPRIPFVWEEKPGRPKHSDSTDHSLSDCNDELFSLNFSDEDSVDFVSATVEFPHSKKKTTSCSTLKLPPRLQQTFSTSDQSRRSSFVASSDDDTESPRLCYENRMEITSTRNRSYFPPSMQMQKSSRSITHDPIEHQLNNGLQISDETRYIRRGISLDLPAYTTTDENRGQVSPATNGLDVLLANFSPDEITEQPGRFFILRESILNAAIIEKSKRILQYHGRSNSRGSQYSSDRSDYESDQRNRSRNKTKQLTKKVYKSFGCGRSSDVIVTAQSNPYSGFRSEDGVLDYSFS